MKKFEDSSKAVEWSTPEEHNDRRFESRGRGDCSWGARKKELLIEMTQEQLHHKPGQWCLSLRASGIKLHNRLLAGDYARGICPQLSTTAPQSVLELQASHNTSYLE